MSEILKINVNPPYRAPKPWLQNALNRGSKHQLKTKKRVRVNDKANFKKEI